MASALNKPGTGAEINYPSGCKEITEDIGKDALIHRLKSLARAFKDMGQDDNDQYVGLARYIGTSFFLEHDSKDVRLLTACCLADVFRVFAPDAPYTEPEHLKEIFLFFIKQLRGLQDPNSPSFKLYFYLLENLAWVKSFNICIELEENQEIFCQLFKLLFTIVSEKHSSKMVNFMLDMMTPLITEADNVSQELLDIILASIVEPQRSVNKSACNMAKDLLKRTANAIEPYVQAFFNNALMLGKTSESEVSGHLYDLIYELNNIAPTILLAVLPQLEFKLKSNEETERRQVTRLLARMFSEPNSDLATQNKPLWTCFLGRFNDINTSVRLICVQFSQYFILHHHELVRDITEQLKVRQHDPEESVRTEVVNGIVTAAKKDFGRVTGELLQFIKERTLDKKFKIRREALLGLSYLYKSIMAVTQPDPKDVERISWVRDKVFHTYYQKNVEDRLLVERIFNTSLVPYHLPTETRMKRYYLLYVTIDGPASKAFHELMKCQNAAKQSLRQLVDILQTDGEGRPPPTSVIHPKLYKLAKHLPEQGKLTDHLKQFSQTVYDDPRIRKYLLTITGTECSVKKAEEAVKEVLKVMGNPSPSNSFYMTVKSILERTAPVMIDTEAIDCLKEVLKVMGNPSPSNSFYMTVKSILERTAPVMIDTEAIDCLVRLVQDTVTGISELTHGLPKVVERGVDLLLLLSSTYPHCFNSESVCGHLLTLLRHEDQAVEDAAIQIFTNTGESLSTRFPAVYKSIIPVMVQCAKMGNPKQAKHAIQCIDKIAENSIGLLQQITEQLMKNFTPESANYLTSIVSLGHIALICPDEIATEFKPFVAKYVVKELLMQDRTMGLETQDSYWPDHRLSEETQAKVQAMKLLVRWLSGLKQNCGNSINSTLRLLHTVIIHDGDLMEKGCINKPELARLRLQAGCCVLKLVEEPTFAKAITLEQFQALALLINDTCYEVRVNFTHKLNRGLLNLRIPLEYMSIFALCANDPSKERRQQAKQHLLSNIQKRREYLRHNSLAMSKIMSYLPDYVIPYTIHLMAHDPDLVTPDNTDVLKSIKECLWFILEPLMQRQDDYNYNFYRRMVENIKQTKDAQDPTDPDTNNKLYAVCDLTLGILVSKSTNVMLKDLAVEPVLPSKLFTDPDESYSNTACYLPPEMRVDMPKELISKMGRKALPEAKIVSKRNIETEVDSTKHTTTMYVVAPSGPVVNRLPRSPRDSEESEEDKAIRSARSVQAAATRKQRRENRSDEEAITKGLRTEKQQAARKKRQETKLVQDLLTQAMEQTSGAYTGPDVPPATVVQQIKEVTEDGGTKTTIIVDSPKPVVNPFGRTTRVNKRKQKQEETAERKKQRQEEKMVEVKQEGKEGERPKRSARVKAQEDDEQEKSSQVCFDSEDDLLPSSCELKDAEIPIIDAITSDTKPQISDVNPQTSEAGVGGSDSEDEPLQKLSQRAKKSADKTNETPIDDIPKPTKTTTKGNKNKTKNAKETKENVKKSTNTKVTKKEKPTQNAENNDTPEKTIDMKKLDELARSKHSPHNLYTNKRLFRHARSSVDWAAQAIRERSDSEENESIPSSPVKPSPVKPSPVKPSLVKTAQTLANKAATKSNVRSVKRDVSKEMSSPLKSNKSSVVSSEGSSPSKVSSSVSDASTTRKRTVNDKGSAKTTKADSTTPDSSLPSSPKKVATTKTVPKKNMRGTISNGTSDGETADSETPCCHLKYLPQNHNLMFL